MRKIICIIVVSFLCTNAAFTQDKIEFKGVFLSERQVHSIKERIQNKVEPTYTAFLALKKSVEAHGNRRPHAPEHWYVPGYYNDAEGHRTAKESLMNDANAAYELALYYRITGETNFARSAIRLIDGWATGVKTMSMKDDSTLSFSYHFPALIFAAGLIRNDPVWPETNQKQFNDFVRNRALTMNTMDRKNNWGNWGLVLVMASAAYLQDEDVFLKGVQRWKEFIDTQIAGDGHLPHEVHRSEGMRGIWYTHFSLMPQTIAAEIAYVNGVGLYEYQSPGGRTLRKAFERIAPWTHHPETFPYYKENPKKLTGTTYISYFEILNPRWPNPDATEMLNELRPMSARHSSPVLTLTHGQ